MKLLVVTPYFYPKLGGLENYAYHISQGLHKKYKWEIVVVTSNHEEKKYKEEMLNGFKIYRLPYWFKLSNTPVNPLWYFAIATIIKSEMPDCINAHTPVPFISDVTARASTKAKIPFVLTYHNDVVKSSLLVSLCIKIYYQLFGFATGKLATTIIATSDFYAKRSLFLKKFAAKVQLVPPGVDVPFYDSINPKPDLIQEYKDKKVVMFVGQLDKTHLHKGLNYLIEAIATVKKDIPNILLLIIGRGDMISEYKDMAQKMGIEDNIVFKTSVEDPDLVAYYKLSDVVVLPTVSNAEGFGMVLIEAGAAKKPVIGTNVGGVPFVIIENETGYLIPPKDVTSLAKKILEVVSDKKLQNRLGNNGYSQAVEKYSWEKQINKTDSILKNI